MLADTTIAVTRMLLGFLAGAQQHFCNLLGSGADCPRNPKNSAASLGRRCSLRLEPRIRAEKRCLSRACRHDHGRNH